MRKFEGGATRDDDTDKYDYEGFLSPIVLERFASYMHKNQVQADGKLRESDNWQKGMEPSVYLKSALRHIHKWWKLHRSTGIESTDEAVDAMCGVLFNTMGAMFEILKGDGEGSDGEGELRLPKAKT
jgi:hypothetical protein